MSVSLRPMREDEFPAFLTHVVVDYARDMVENGGLDPDVARAKSEADHARILPDGLATEGTALFVVERDDTAVGHVFFAEQERFGSRHAHLYSIEISPDWRGKGLGRAALELLEHEVRARGLRRIELNVFGGNEVARSLYRSSGYEELAVAMVKELG